MNKITELPAPDSGWLYHSRTSVYVERFRDGRLMFASLQDTGVPWYPRDEEKEIHAFDLQIDGEALYFGWFLENSTTNVENGISICRLTLRHERKAVRLEIVTEAGDEGFFRRRMRLTNLADVPVGLTSVTPLRGALWRMADDYRESLSASGEAPFRVGWMKDINWGYEGNFQWEEIPNHAELAFGSTTGRSGFSSPFAIAHNNLYGGYFAAALAWPANWRMSFKAEQFRGGPARLHFAIMPQGVAPMRMIAAGETIDLPEVHFGLNHENFDAIVQGWHRHLRRHVLIRHADERQPVIYNHWSYTEHELSEASLRREVDVAAEIGAELFMVDAGWYADAETPWFATSGDWVAGNRLPNDLFPIYDYVRAKGLKCGLWVEIESAGTASKLAKERPEWFITRYGSPVERVLDLAKPEVVAHLEAHIVRLVERYRLDMFRLDYNLDAHEGGFNERDGRMENTLWRHAEAIYGMFDRVRQRFPDLLLENCSSGGARNDVGMVSRFHTTWISDWLRMPRTVQILNGMTMAFPPEYLNRTFGVTMQGSYRGNVETQLQVLILGHPAISGLAPELAAANPELMEVTKKYLGIYKEFLRPFHRTARVYHHTPVIPGPDASGWCALEYVAEDKKRAVAAVFRLVNAPGDEYELRLRGLDSNVRYQVTFQPGGAMAEITGFSLQQVGIRLRLDTPLTSTLLLIEAI